MVKSPVPVSAVFPSKELAAGHAAHASLEKVDLDPRPIPNRSVLTCRAAVRGRSMTGSALQPWICDNVRLACSTPEGGSGRLRCTWHTLPALHGFIGSGNSSFDHRDGNVAAGDDTRACGHVAATGHRRFDFFDFGGMVPASLGRVLGSAARLVPSGFPLTFSISGANFTPRVTRAAPSVVLSSAFTLSRFVGELLFGSPHNAWHNPHYPTSNRSP